MLDRHAHLLRIVVCLGLLGCDAPAPGEPDPSIVLMTSDAGLRPGEDAGPALGADAGVGVDAGPAGATAAWERCAEAVVFGAEGEPCTFVGSCAECALVTSPRQVVCVGGALRFAEAGPGSCGSEGSSPPEIADPGPTRDCTSLRYPAPTAAACSAAVVSCLDGGGGAACVDAEPACEACVRRDLAACTTAHGCDDEAAALQCCRYDSCAVGDDACAAARCAAEQTRYLDCANDTSCRLSDVCFPASGPACGPRRWTAPPPDQCAAATRGCLAAARTQAEARACLQADPNGDCAACVTTEQAYCATSPALATSCGPALGTLECCLEAACPIGASSASCWTDAQGPGGVCEGQAYDVWSCVGARVSEGACPTTDHCFAS